MDYISGMDAPIHFGSFSFFPERGELVFRENNGRETNTRLAPQPSKLLVLLLEKYPDIVSQEEIKQAIWPEVQVDFEKSLHYCIRQIRSALNDSAAQPNFIETIPRRGYRWKVEWEDASPETPSGKSRLPVSGLLLLALPVVLLLLYFFGSREANPITEAEVPKRIAVMSFQPPYDTGTFVGNDIALQLVESLTNSHPKTLEVIGPTTTANYTSAQLQALIEDFDIDIILNGRYSRDNPSGRLLAEVIRASDGAHVWVKYFDPESGYGFIADSIQKGLRESFQF